jgi:hypothetical protein
MVDTFRPLYLTRQAAELENPSYPYTWLETSGAAEEARHLAERGPEAFPD